ncbi:ZNFX1 [Symbiodinium sp. CCMP2592]|nr:ZNFX1 [Symbiodinium sp. CCMP2592]
MGPRAGESRKLSGKVVHVSADGRYGYIRVNNRRGPDVHFWMDVVRDSGGLSLDFGDRVDLWIQPQGEGRTTAGAVHLVSLARDTDRRKKALAQMEQWRQQICMQNPPVQDAKFQARSGRALWQAVLDLLEPTMRNETWQAEARRGPGPSSASPPSQSAEAASPITCRHAFCAERHYAEKVYLQNRALRNDPAEQSSMSVEEVNYTHAEISDQFGDGRPLESLLADLRRGKILPSDDRMQLEACLLKDKYRSLNNRRLRVLKLFHSEQKRMDPTCDVQVQVQLRPLCKSTARFIQELCKSDDRSEQTSPLHPGAKQAKQTLSDIENASVQNRKNALVTKWALSSLGKAQEVLVSALTYIGAPTRQRTGLINTVSRDKRRRLDDDMTNMINIKREQVINGEEVEVVEFEEKLYMLNQKLCKALQDKQDRQREAIKIKIRIVPLCPWTAKMVLANSSRTDGKDVESKGSESEWPLCRLVYLLLDLANGLAQEPNFASTFDLIAASALLGQGALIAALKEQEHGSRMWEAAALLLLNLFKLAPTGSKAAMPVCAYMQDVTDELRDLEESNCQSRRWLNLLSFSTRAIVGRSSDAYEANWDMLSLVPTLHQIQRGEDQWNRRRNARELPTVRERGRYNSEQHYLDTYFRLLREECLAAIRSTLHHVGNGNMEAEQIRRDGNIFDACLTGFNVSRNQGGVLDSRIKVVFRVRPNGTWERWRSKMDRSFKFGNLVACISDNAVSQPIWMLVACRDVKNRTVALGLYSAGEDDTTRLARMWDAGKLMLIASTTYFRSLEPVLRRLQDAEQVGFPFKEELVYCQTTPRRPSNVHAADPVDWKLFFRGPRPDVKDDCKFLVVGGPEPSGRPVRFTGTSVESPDGEALFKVFLTKHDGEYGFRLQNLAGQIFIQLPGTETGIPSQGPV